MSKSKHSRRRPSSEEVRRNAKRSAGKQQFFNLPRGVREWSPEKSGSYLLDVVPYEVTSSHHPDHTDKGVLWYKYPFHIHRDVGPAGEQVVCPTSVNKRCPICEHRAKLLKDGRDRDDEAVRALNFQDWVAYNIIDPDDSDSIAVFAMSKGKFAKPLEKELDSDDAEEARLFFLCDENGRTLKVRFSDATFDGRKYLEATRFDFRERKEMDEDEILGKVVNLDECFNVLPYDELKALFLQIDDEDEEEPKGKGSDDEDEEEEEEEKPKRKGGKSEPEEEDDEEDDEEEPPFEKGDKVTWKKGKKTLVGTVTKVAEDCIHVKDEAGEKHQLDQDDLTAVEDEEDEEDEDKEEEEEKPKGKGKGGKGKCPHGHKFGVDIDKYKECGNCKVWEDCDAAST